MAIDLAEWIADQRIFFAGTTRFSSADVNVSRKGGGALRILGLLEKAPELLTYHIKQAAKNRGLTAQWRVVCPMERRSAIHASVVVESRRSLRAI